MKLKPKARADRPNPTAYTLAIGSAEAREAGLKLAILSNELDLFYGVEFRKRFPLIELFDVIVDATYTKILKPDPRAYEQVIAEGRRGF